MKGKEWRRESNLNTMYVLSHKYVGLCVTLQYYIIWGAVDYWTIFWDAAMRRSVRGDTGWGWYWTTANVVEKHNEAEWIFFKSETDDAFDKIDIIYYVNNNIVTMVITEEVIMPFP
jgi:hypothetical protein